MANKDIKRLININGKDIEYTIIYKKVKNINLRIKTDGTITISANTTMSIDRLDRFMLEKQDFVLGALERFHGFTPAIRVVQSLLSDSIIQIWGKEYIVKLIENVKGRIEIYEDKINIYAKNCNNQESVKRVFYKWMNEETLSVFLIIMERQVKEFSQYNIVVPKITVRDMKSRWGSCNYATKMITLNKRLIIFPICCTEYVIYHELCHLIYPNHSKDFHDLLEKMCPNADEISKFLI